jgi:hypothetical protein
VSIGGIGVVLNSASVIKDIHSEAEYHDYVASLVNISRSEFTANKYDILGTFVQTAEHAGYSNFSTNGEFFGTINQGIDAPPGSPRGPNGSGAILWGRFNATEGSWGVQQIYRVKSAGGQAPATCAGLADHVEVEFAADSWMYN